MCSWFFDSTVWFLVNEKYHRVVNILDWIKRMNSALDICIFCSKYLSSTFLWFFNRLLSCFCKLLLLPYVVRGCQSVHRVVPISWCTRNLAHDVLGQAPFWPSPRFPRKKWPGRRAPAKPKSHLGRTNRKDQPWMKALTLALVPWKDQPRGENPGRTSQERSYKKEVSLNPPLPN